VNFVMHRFPPHHSYRIYTDSSTERSNPVFSHEQQQTSSAPDMNVLPAPKKNILSTLLRV
jgi:hypothetical protein